MVLRARRGLKPHDYAWDKSRLRACGHEIPLKGTMPAFAGWELTAHYLI